MKNQLFAHRAVVYIQTMLLFLILWGMWYFNYRHILIWLEGFSYFSTLPDFTSIQMDLPDEAFKYAGTYLLQFFRIPLLGAAVQAAFATWVMVCVQRCILRLTGKVQLTWLAFLPVPWFVAGQYEDMTLERSMLWAALAMAAAALCSLPWGKKFRLPAPRWLQWPVWVVGVPVAAVGFSVHLLSDKVNGHKYQEGLCRIDYHANRQEWQQVLQLISPQEAREDEFKRRYALLALSETGQLADRAFGYGLTNYNQFLFVGNEDPFERSFNAYFYRSLGMQNEVVHQAYQLSLTSPFGFNFKSLRLLTDACLEMGDKALAEKYIEVLRHSSFHGRWIEERVARLESIRDRLGNDAVTDAPFVGNIQETLVSLANQYPTDRKIVDQCLCAILATGNLEYFYLAFDIVAEGLYATGTRIPRCYEEALLLMAMDNKEIMRKYPVSEATRNRFTDFISLVQGGKLNAAKAKYPDSYWSFVF